MKKPASDWIVSHPQPPIPVHAGCFCERKVRWSTPVSRDCVMKTIALFITIDTGLPRSTPWPSAMLTRLLRGGLSPSTGLAPKPWYHTSMNDGSERSSTQLRWLFSSHRSRFVVHTWIPFHHITANIEQNASSVLGWSVGGHWS